MRSRLCVGSSEGPTHLEFLSHSPMKVWPHFSLSVVDTQLVCHPLLHLFELQRDGHEHAFSAGLVPLRAAVKS